MYNKIYSRQPPLYYSASRCGQLREFIRAARRGEYAESEKRDVGQTRGRCVIGERFSASLKRSFRES